MKFNDSFWKWFGDSKVVDDRGEPMEVYHGGSTREVYSEFKPRKALRSLGFMGAQYEVDATTYFFSESKRMARLFAENRAGHRGDAWVMGVYLSIQNPIDLSGDLKTSERALKSAGCNYWGEGDKATLWKIFDRPKEVVRLISAGYDGALIFDSDAARFFKEQKDPKAKVTWIAFHPSQIKSAVGNDGSWDVDDPDIRSNPLVEPYPLNYIEGERFVVGHINGYDIVVDDSENASNAYAYKGNNQVGYIAMTDGECGGRRGNRWLGVQSISVDREHRNKGVASLLYEAILRHMHKSYKGISSYLPDRLNKYEIPLIYEKLGGYEEGDCAYIPRKRK